MKTVVILSANAEWRAALDYYPAAPRLQTPAWDAFEADLPGHGKVVFLHGGWGKISAAASAQYALNRWNPDLLVNLGTCGGFAGLVERGEVLLVDSTAVYDIVEMMHDPQEAIDFYATQLDLAWLRPPYPHAVRQVRLISADRDLNPADTPALAQQYNALAGDWESGAIAWVAQRNGVRCLILRGVSDLVTTAGGEAYADAQVFEDGASQIITGLLTALPAWLDCVNCA